MDFLSHKVSDWLAARLVFCPGSLFAGYLPLTGSAVERHVVKRVSRGVLDSDLSKRKHVSIPKKMLAGTTLMRRDDRSALAKPTSTAASKVLEVV